MLSDAELTALRSFWIWESQKEKWEFIRNWEEHKVDAMKKFEDYVFGRGGILRRGVDTPLPLSRWLQ
jgi:hypothetical protein